MTMLAMLLAIAPLAAALAQEPPRPPVLIPRARMPHGPPPLVNGDERAMLTWEPTILRCGGKPVTATPIRRPWNALVWPGYKGTPVSFSFAVDATGRTTGITRQRSDAPAFAEDLGPVLAATRFPAGAPLKGCMIVYAPQLTSMAETPIADLISYTLTPDQGPLPMPGWQRIVAAGTCHQDPRPAPLLQAYPDFAMVPGTPGVRDWSMVRYDTDAKGRPVNARITTGTGNAALDAASIKAIRASRYTGGARIGCLYPYWRMPDPLAAPPMPPEADFRPATATCLLHHDWITGPVLRFPENYRKRSIEGWAIVTYDLAPWGEPGNIQAVAAAPSGDFGTQAIAMIRGARLPASDRGATGCVDRVVFKMGGTTASAPAPF